MARLRALSGREVCRIVASHGFVDVRRCGSYVVMQKADAEGIITAPVQDHGQLHTGTLMSIIWQSGVPRSEFE